MVSTIANETLNVWGAFDSFSAGMAFLDLDGNWLKVNKAFCTLLGYSSEEFITKTIADITHPEDVEKSLSLLQDLVRKGSGNYQFEKRFVRKDGQYVWALLTVALVDGDPPFISGQIEDITRRRRAETALRKSELLFRTITENAGDLILVANSLGQTLYASPAYERILGFSPKELIGRSCLDIIHPSDQRRIALAIRETFRTGEQSILELRARDKQGCWHYVQSHGSLIREGGKSSLVVVSRLFDEQVKNEHASHYREKLRNAVLRASQLLTGGTLENTIPTILSTMAEVLEVDRVLVIESQHQNTHLNLCYSWQKPEVSQVTNDTFLEYPFTSPDFHRWMGSLADGRHVLNSFPGATGIAAELLKKVGMQSILTVPIIVEGDLWGCLGVDAQAGREWIGPEINLLYVLANMIANTISRDRNQRLLQDSEQRFRAVAEAALDGIVVTDSSAVITYWNPAAERILGYSPTEALGHAVHSWLAPTSYQREAMDALRNFAANGGEAMIGRTLEVSATRKDGTEIPIELSISSMKAEDGWNAVGVLRDVSSRYRAQEALKAREEQLQLILDSTAEAIFGLNPDGTCSFCNNSCLRALGYTSEDQLLGKLVHDQIHSGTPFGEPIDNSDCGIYRTLKSGKGSHCDDTCFVRSDGSFFPVEYWAYPIIRDYEVVGCVVTFLDISQRKESESEVRRAHKQSETLINAMPAILIGTTSKGVIVRWNKTAEDVFQLSSFDVLGSSLFDCGVSWLGPDLRTSVEAALSQHREYRNDALPFESENSIRYVSLKIKSVVLDEDGEEGWVITGADITGRLSLEQQLRQSQKLEAIGQLAAGIAHEINTPIQFIGDNVNFFKQSWEELVSALQTMAQLHLHSPADCPMEHGMSRRSGTPCKFADEYEKALKQLDLDYLMKEIPPAISQTLEGVQRVSAIVRAMKEFSHPGSEQMKYTDINRAIETTITVARNEWKYVAELKTSLDPNLPPVPCYPGELNQVLLNLITNAAHAISQVQGREGKGVIEISTITSNDGALIRISDTGVGIPASIQHRIFEPFFTTKSVGQGTGQGLSLAHSIVVKKHGGRLSFESQVGEGTTFSIWLPLRAIKVEES